MKKRALPVKAYDNHDFLHGHAARYIRVLAEFMEPAERLKEKGICNTIVFFGSARSKPVSAYKKGPRQPGTDYEKGLLVAKGYEASAALARKITLWSNKIKDPAKRFAICSGGGPGMMEAANKGAVLGRGKSIGLNISLPFEQVPNPYITPGLNFEFHYFFVRKFWFLYHAKALVAFPGGFGTFDEVFELLTLIQTEKLQKKVPIVLFGKAFWNEVLNFDALVKYGVIGREDLKLFRILDDVDEAFRYITKELKEYHV